MVWSLATGFWFPLMSWPFPMESAHPLVVHFPIALLLTGAGLELLAVLSKRAAWHRVALWNLALGVLAAALAVWTGLQAAGIAKHSFDIHQVMSRHEQLGKITLGLGAIVVSGRLLQRDRVSQRTRLVLLALTLLMVGTLAWGAHLGGRLVYEFGVGGRFGL